MTWSKSLTGGLGRVTEQGPKSLPFLTLGPLDAQSLVVADRSTTRLATAPLPYSAGIPPEVSLAVAVPRPLRLSLGSGGFSPGTLPAAPAGATPPVQACARHVSLRVSLPGYAHVLAPPVVSPAVPSRVNHHTRKGHQTK